MAVAAVAVVMFTGSSAEIPAAVTVQEVVNRVEADRPRDSAPDSINFLPAAIGQDLLAGDAIKTYEGSEARVDIVVGDFIRVTRTKPNTLWRLGQFVLDEDTIIEIEQGRVFLFDDGDDPDPRPIKVITPAGTAFPRGTWMSFAHDPVKKEAELQCFRGTCVLENGLGTQVLVDEQKSTATIETPPEEPLVMSAAETKEFEELPEAKTGEVIIPTPEPPAPTAGPSGNPEATSPAPSTVPTQQATAGPQASPTPDTPATPSPLPTEPPAPTAQPEVRPEAPSNTPVPVVTPVPPPTSRPLPTPDRVTRVAPTPVPTPSRTPTTMPSPTPHPTATPTPVDVPLPPVNPQALPHIFVGTAKLGGLPAPDGTEITAWMEGFSEFLARSEVGSNAFNILVPQYGPGPFDGRTIEFRLDGIVAEPTVTWVRGGADVVDLIASPDPNP